MQSPDNTQQGIRQIVDRFAAVIICSMLAEQLFQLRGHVSFRLTLLFGLTCMLTLRGIFFQRGLWILVLTGGAFAISAYYTGRGYRFVQGDLFSIFQGAVISGFVSLRHFSEKRRVEFWFFVHRGFVLLGALAGYGGLAKLVLFNRGVILPFLFTDEGMYPPGSSLNGDYNFFSLGLVVAMGSASWLLQRDRNYFFYLLSHLALPGMIAAVLLTSSRRALIFLAIGALLLFFTRVWRRNKAGALLARNMERRGRWLIGVTYVVLLAIAGTNHKLVTERITSFFSEHEVQVVTERARTLGTEESIAGRTLYWQVTYRMLADSTIGQLLAGSGFGYISEMGAIGGVDEDYPHNFILSALLYGGAFQAVLTLIMVGMVLKRSLSAGPEFRVVVFWILIFLLFHLSSSNSIFSSELFVVIMVLSLDALPVFPRRVPRHDPATHQRPAPGFRRRRPSP